MKLLKTISEGDKKKWFIPSYLGEYEVFMEPYVMRMNYEKFHIHDEYVEDIYTMELKLKYLVYSIVEEMFKKDHDAILRKINIIADEILKTYDNFLPAVLNDILNLAMSNVKKTSS